MTPTHEAAWDKVKRGQDLEIDDCINLILDVEGGNIQDKVTSYRAIELINKRLGPLFEGAANDNDAVSTLKPPNRRLVQAAQDSIAGFRSRLLNLSMNRTVDNAISSWATYIERLKAAVYRRTLPLKRKGKKANESFDDVFAGVAEYREKAIKLKAVKLSMSRHFQNVLKELREKWKIESNFQYEPSELSWIKPESVLRNLAIKRDLSDREWHQLQGNLKSRLFTEHFDLIWPQDYGLVVAALCFGLTPDDILSSWQTIWLLARQESDLSSDVFIRIDDSEKFAAALLSLAYLAENPFAIFGNPESLDEDAQANTKNLPPNVLAWVDFATDFARKVVASVSGADEAIELMRALPDDPSVSQPELWLRIHPATQLPDIERSWEIVELKKFLLWGEEHRDGNRISRTWKRDYELYTLYQELHDYPQVVKEYDRLHPNNRINKDQDYDPIHPDTLDMVKKAIKSIVNQKLGKGN